MKVEDVEAEMKELEGNFEKKDVMNFYLWWKEESMLPWSRMVEEMERNGVAEMIARYNLEKEET